MDAKLLLLLLLFSQVKLRKKVKKIQCPRKSHYEI